jgi:hypothetical protein
VRQKKLAPGVLTGPRAADSGRPVRCFLEVSIRSERDRPRQARQLRRDLVIRHPIDIFARNDEPLIRRHQMRALCTHEECPKCGENMREVAGEKLVEMFADERTPAKFKQMLVMFIAASAGVPALILLLPRTWWMYAMIPYFVLLQPMIYFFNWQVHSPRFRCDCGESAYKLMGMLGRSYCYRCTICGRLLRLRD